MEKMKICPDCMQTRPLSEFYKNRARYDGHSGQCWECHSATLSISRQKIRRQILAKYGGKCVRCGFDDADCLQIDHVNSDGSYDRAFTTSPSRMNRKILEDTSGMYQLLCANCNCKKRVEAGEQFRRKSDRILGPLVSIKNHIRRVDDLPQSRKDEFEEDKRQSLADDLQRKRIAIQSAWDNPEKREQRVSKRRETIAALKEAIPGYEDALDVHREVAQANAAKARRALRGTLSRYWQLNDAAWLREQYHEKGISLAEIALLIGMPNGADGKGAVSKSLKTHGIPTRTTGDGKRLRDARKLSAAGGEPDA